MATPSPAATASAKVAPTQPEPAQPEPAQPEPAQLEPAKPEQPQPKRELATGATPMPAAATQATLEPATPEPAPAVPTLAPAEPAAPPPEPQPAAVSAAPMGGVTAVAKQLVLVLGIGRGGCAALRATARFVATRAGSARPRARSPPARCSCALPRRARAQAVLARA